MMAGSYLVKFARTLFILNNPMEEFWAEANKKEKNNSPSMKASETKVYLGKRTSRNTTPFPKNELKTVLFPKHLPILNCLSIVENIYSTIVLFVATWTLYKFSQTTLNHLHDLPPIPIAPKYWFRLS